MKPGIATPLPGHKKPVSSIFPTLAEGTGDWKFMPNPSGLSVGFYPAKSHEFVFYRYRQEYANIYQFGPVP
jgi:hypothetical protein